MELHKSVLLKESLGLLNIEEGDIYLDATLGAGGHAEEVWQKFGNKVIIAGIDADSGAVEISRQRLEIVGAKPNFITLNFRNIDKAQELLGIGRPSKIFYDLGWNKMQFDPLEGEAGRGFSFQRDEPLIMTFSTDLGNDQFTASTIVNEWGEDSIKSIIEGYGDERFASRIAKAIVTRRAEKPIETTFELAQIVKEATPLWYHFKRIHPATRTFQALRITVNDELRALEESLQKSFEMLMVGGRIAVISFHSLEDRIVKRFFKELAVMGRAEIITKKPIEASDKEVELNPRSRSAKLRAIKKISE